MRVGLPATVGNGTFLGQKSSVSTPQSSVTVVFVAKNSIAMDDIVASLTLAAL